MQRILSSLGIDIRRGEASAALLLFFCFFLFITFQYTTKSVRQSTFIDSLGAARLPYVYLLVALCSYPLLRLYSAQVDRMRRHTLMATTCLVVLSSFLLFWWLYRFPWPWVPVAFYVWVSIVFVLTVSQFWSYTNHVFDARQAKRLFGFIGAGGLLGGIAGGQVARMATQVVGTRYALLVAAAILAVIVGLVYVIHRVAPADDETAPGAAGLGKLDEARGGFEVIRRSRMLQLIGAVLVLCVMVAQVVDLQFNWAVQQATTELDQRTAFFGNFYSIMGITAFLFQLIFTARIHRSLGVGFAMRVLPVSMAVGTVTLFVTALALPEALIAAALMLKIGENGIRYSLDQATRELLFLPVPSSSRLKAKAFIDVFLQRGAKGLAALLLLPVALGLMTELQAGWISLGLIALWLAVTVAAYREYVASFRRALERGTVDAETLIDVAEGHTLESLMQSLASTEPRRVLRALEMLSAHGRGNLVSPLLVHHEAPEVRRRTLIVLAEAGRQDAVSLIEQRLSDDDPDVRAEAIHALTRIQHHDVTTLMLPRLEESDPGVRAAAVASLVEHEEPNVVSQAHAALTEMLLDSDPVVRVEAAKAVGAIPPPGFEVELLQLIYDADPRVVRSALASVRRRIARGRPIKAYLPTLISLLENRHVKREARDTLVACGPMAVPLLVYFMNDPDESLWVRRGLPKTLARIGGPQARDALLDCLGKPADAFLRRKIIEALESLSDESPPATMASAVHREIGAEARRYFVALADLWSLEIHRVARFESPRVRWAETEYEPSLLERLLVERMDDHLRNIFGLLALLHGHKDVWAAHRALVGARGRRRVSALEYLDNALSGELRTQVFTVIDDTSLEEKLRLAGKLFDVRATSKVETLRRIIGSPAPNDPGAQDLAFAAIYVAYTDRVSELYPLVERAALQEAYPELKELASWISRRLGP